jgi:hypothetical protein
MDSFQIRWWILRFASSIIYLVCRFLITDKQRQVCPLFSYPDILHQEITGKTIYGAGVAPGSPHPIQFGNPGVLQ